jgi:signal transduction histidine kinase
MLPQPVADYLTARVARQLRPFTLSVDQRWRLRECWGEAHDIGLSAFEIGADVRESAPCLFGQDTAHSFTLPMVTMGTGGVLDVHCLPTPDGAYIVFVHVDDEHDSRQRLQQTANEVRLMNDRQQKLLAELSLAKEKLEQRERALTIANDVKSRFIAGMSHEFRTPLTAILGYSELILDRASNETDIAAHSQAVARAARHLLSMVDNILDQARLDDGNVLLSQGPVNVRDLVDDLAAIMAPLAAARFIAFGAYVASAVPQAIVTDVVRLRQVLLNLLGNAVKFTERGEVRLEVDWHGGALQAAVIDTGPGIAADELQSIFEEYRRGRGTDGVRGVGLGLNIARRLTELLGGTVDVESEVGRGSRFWVSLPTTETTLASLKVATSARPVAASAASRDARVLIAEDDPDIIELVQIILRRANYQVTIAMNGRDAVECALEMQPDLILMDVNMPEMNGVEAARAMRAGGLRCPIIALSASLGVNDRNGAIEAGYDTYLVKPIAAADLLAAIEHHLQEA